MPNFLWNFFSSFPSNERSIWHKSDINPRLFFFLQIFGKKVGNFGICWDISNFFTDLESAFKSGQFEHLKTIVAWILGTRSGTMKLFFLAIFNSGRCSMPQNDPDNNPKWNPKENPSFFQPNQLDWGPNNDTKRTFWD